MQEVGDLKHIGEGEKSKLVNDTTDGQALVPLTHKQSSELLLLLLLITGSPNSPAVEQPSVFPREKVVSWAEKLGKQLGRPTRSVAGWLVSKLLTARNQVLEENAVQLCGIQPGDTVLELGHGPGLGLQSAARLLTGPTGRLIGVDYSEYMHQMAKERMKELIASGKVTLHHCDVAAMPLADSTVDKVFHCNCYYFWPDLRKGAREIHRVMKPGALMVTTLRHNHLATLAAKRVMPGDNWRPEAYMAALRDSGFTDVRMEDKQDKNITFQAIYATALN